MAYTGPLKKTRKPRSFANGNGYYDAKINRPDGRVTMPYDFTADDIAYLLAPGGEIVYELPEARGDEI